MEKKNPYITTIGFNKDDTEHLKVANLLNEMGRGKAAYIVKTVLYYEAMKIDEEVPSLGWGIEMDYGRLRKFVLQVIEEHEKGIISLLNKKEDYNNSDEKKAEKEDAMAQIEFDESAIHEILLSVEAFRCGLPVNFLTQE